MRVILLTTARSYRTEAFVAAARELGVEVVVGIDMERPLAELWRAPLALDFCDPETAVQAIVRFAAGQPVCAVLGIDDSATVLAAKASAALGLPHNAPEAALAARDKHRMRQLLRQAGVPVPRFRLYPVTSDPAAIAVEVSYPCVVKPTLLSGSRGVIRADNPTEFAAAFRRTRAIIEAAGVEYPTASGTAGILVEEFIPGGEVALEGMLAGGELSVLALFDKPDPLDGPFFEETIYVTPSRLPAAAQEAIARRAAQAAAALGLREGPLHAELRVNEAGPWLVEAAGRSIGGHCSRMLRFGTGMSLEELILRHACGMEWQARRAGEAVGVMMLPIPARGIFRGVSGTEAARAVPGIRELEITAARGYPVVPLPEGASYLGFLFAAGRTPGEVEAALRAAHACLRFEIAPEMVVLG
jgi:biotin carboxylase